MTPLKHYRIFIGMAACLSLLGSSGLGADAPALRTVQVPSMEEVNSWKLKFETLAEFKLVMDLKLGTDGAAVRSGDASLFASLVEPKSNGDMQLVWAVFNESKGSFGFSGFGVFVDREGKRIKQFTLAPDDGEAHQYLNMVRVEFSRKDGNGNEFKEWRDRQVLAYYTTMKEIPDNAVALVLVLFLSDGDNSKEDKPRRVDFMLTLPPAKPKNGNGR